MQTTGDFIEKSPLSPICPPKKFIKKLGETNLVVHTNTYVVKIRVDQMLIVQNLKRKS